MYEKQNWTNIEGETPFTAERMEHIENGIYDNSNSIDTVNKNLKGTILWTNPNPEQAFESQKVTLNSDDYDISKIFYRHFCGDKTCFSQEVIKGYNGALEKVDIDDATQTREFTYISDTELSFGEGKFMHPSYSEPKTQNTRCVPMFIVGYKTGLFD